MLEDTFREFKSTKDALETVLKYDPDDAVGIAVLRAKMKELTDKLRGSTVSREGGDGK